MANLSSLKRPLRPNTFVFRNPGDSTWTMFIESREGYLDANTEVFVLPEVTCVCLWLIKSNGGLFRLTNRRYSTEAEVRSACCLATTTRVYPLDDTALWLVDYDVPLSDATEFDRAIKHSGGCQGESS